MFRLKLLSFQKIYLYFCVRLLLYKLMRQLKLIWDFRGPVAQKTAEHHLIHLKEYINIEKLDIKITGVEQLNDMHSIAYLVVVESEMIPIRDALKPHRGQVYQD